MINGRIQKIGEAYAVILDDDARESLGVAEGDVVFISAPVENQISHEEAVERGKTFFARYRKTFEALAR